MPTNFKTQRVGQHVKEPRAMPGNRLILLGKSGQAAVEYVLLVAVCVLIFGAMFAAIRQSLYKVWICEIAPRVQSVGGCSTLSSTSCWKSLKKTNPDLQVPPVCPQ